MSTKVKRRDPYLDEAVTILDTFYERSKGDVDLAYSMLPSSWKKFIDEEIARCAQPITGLKYYLENYHCIATEYEGIKTLFPFWDSQEIFFDKVLQLMKRPAEPGLLHAAVRIIVLKARQLGLSTISAGITFHKTIFTEVCNTLVMAQDKEQADYLFSMQRRAYDNLPWWMRPEARYESKSRYLVFERKDPVKRMQNPGLRSQILVDAANKPTGAAIGKTFRTCHLSELSAWLNPETLTTQLLPSMNAPDEIAIMESTARGRKGFWYRFWRDVWDGEIPGWEPVFIEFFRVRKYSFPLKEGEEFTLTAEETAIKDKVKEQVNYDIKPEQFKWRRHKLAEVVSIQGDEWKFYEQYPGATWMEAFQGTGICAFNKRRLQQLMETTCRPPAWTGEIILEKNTQPKLIGRYMRKTDRLPQQKTHGSRLFIWEFPQENENYYVGADVAHGVEGGNFSVAQVIKIGRGPEPDVQVAEWHGWINPDPYADVLAGLGWLYNTAQVCVECNDVGLSTNSRLMRVLEYENLYVWKHFDKIKNFTSDFLGWYTNSKTRDQIIAKFRTAMDENTIILRSEALIDECQDFAQDDSGSRFEAQEGDDDRVFAIMIAVFCAHDSDFGIEASLQPRKKSVNERSPKDPDFSNTAYSPIHDKAGLRHEMVYDREVPAEVLMYDQVSSAPLGNEEDEWRKW
jgi:hypothetical protein